MMIYLIFVNPSKSLIQALIIALSRYRVVSPVSLFARESFCPWVVLPVGRFAPGHFALCHFARESFCHYSVGCFALIF